MTFASLLRRGAQTLRHAPLLRHASPLWSLCRRPYLAVLRYMSWNRGLVVRVGDEPIVLHPDFATQNWEEIEYASYRRFAASLRQGDVVYDIGAHIGTYSILATRKIGATGRVVAFEPADYTRGMLRQHLRWNGCEDQVIVRDECCAATEGDIDFFVVPRRAEGANSIVADAGFSRVVAKATTIDSVVASSRLVPTLLKIDIEGGEFDALRGAQRTLQQHRPTLFVSLHPRELERRGEAADDLMRWIEAFGYRAEVLERDHEVHVLFTPRALSQ